jgi:SanA protein
MIKKIVKYGLLLCVFGILFILGLNIYIEKTSNKRIYSDKEKIPNCYTGLVLGAKVYDDGRLSGILRDRVESALELYRIGKIKRFLLSGDHGRTKYDEVNQMKKYLIKKGVPKEDIFLDHAGFDTYDSAIRAKKVFLADDVIIITQNFHVKRAVYIANSLGLNAYGFIADKHQYGIAKRMYVREKVANVKAFFELLIHKNPRFLGEKISIKGDSKLSYD